MGCLFSICSPGFPPDRWRSHPITFLNNQSPNAHSPSPAQSRLYTPSRKGSKDYSNFECPESLLSSALRGVNNSRPAPGLRPSPLSEVLAGLPWRGRPQQQRLAGRSSGPGGAAAAASSCPTELHRAADCRSCASPFCTGAHPRNSAGKSCFPHPTLLPVKP